MSETGNEFTVQGGDTLVPVDTLGVRAGPDRPSSSDRPVTPVGNQAGSPYIATGSHKRLRLANLNISPTSSCGSSSPNPITPAPNCQVLDLTWDDEAVTSVPSARKRGREEDTCTRVQEKEERAMFEKFKRLLNEAGAASKRLSAAIATSNNTRTDIKSAAGALSSILSQLQTKGMEETLERLEATSLGGGVTYVVEATVEKKDAGTQTTAWHREPEAPRNVGEELAKGNKSEAHFTKISKWTWPEEAYQNTKLVEGAILQNQRVAFWQDPDDPGLEQGLGSMIRQRHPDILEVAEPVGLLTVTSRITKDGVEAKKDRLYYRLSQGNTLGEQLRSLAILRDVLVVEPEEEVNVALAAPRDDSQHRKTAEYIFGGTKVHLQIYDSRPELGREGGSRAPKEEGIVVRQNNVSYADLLKKVKVAVGDGKDGIKDVRKTRDGSVLLVLEKGKERAVQLTTKLKTEIAGATTKRITKDCTVFNVFDVDEVATKEEVAKAIADKIPGASGKVEVTNIRPTRNEKRIATIAVANEVAAAVGRMGRVRIGLAPCRIKERKEVIKCFRCWDFGHESRNCKGADRRGLCLRCGEAGHIAAGCTKEENCPMCAMKGHRVGSGKCQAFRKALQAVGTPKPAPRNRRVIAMD